MGLQNASILKGATTSFTGGTARTLSTDSLQVKNGIHLIDASVADYTTRPNVYVAATPPVYVPSEKDYTNAKKSVKGYFPKVTANGNVKAPSIEIIIRDNPTQTAAEVQEMVDFAIQVLADSDFANFRSTGSLS